MLKLGIHTIEGLRADLAGRPGRRVRQVAIPLLSVLGDEPDSDKLRERVLLELADDRGAYKRTYRKRFDVFDESACELIRDRFSRDEPLAVLDCGISDGRTAVDFFQKLAGAYVELKYLGTDYDPYVKIVRDRAVTVVFSSKNQPLQMIRPPFVFNLKRLELERWSRYPVNRFLVGVLYKRHVPAMLKQIAESHSGETIALFCNDATKLAAHDQRFRLERYDVLQSPPGRYHVIRMMNLLNPTYFSEAEFDRIIANVRNGLVDGCLFVIGSNHDAGTEIEGGIYSFKNGRFTRLLENRLAPQVKAAIDRVARS